MAAERIRTKKDSRNDSRMV